MCAHMQAGAKNFDPIKRLTNTFTNKAIRFSLLHSLHFIRQFYFQSDKAVFCALITVPEYNADNTHILNKQLT